MRLLLGAGFLFVLWGPMFLAEATYVTLPEYEEDRLSGGPMWLPTQKFDIQVKMSSDDVAAFKSLSLDQQERCFRRCSMNALI